MPVVIEENSEKKNAGRAIVSDLVKSHADDPFFVKKREKAKETIKRVGLPTIEKK